MIGEVAPLLSFIHCGRQALLGLVHVLVVKHLDNRTYMYDIIFMKSSEFIRRIKRVGSKRGVRVRFVTHQGKGSHGRLYYGERFTTVKDRKKEIGHGLLLAMLKQLGLKQEEIS